MEKQIQKEIPDDVKPRTHDSLELWRWLFALAIIARIEGEVNGTLEAREWAWDLVR
jgi:hypothetical protein